jgi:hypothetical protein
VHDRIRAGREAERVGPGLECLDAERERVPARRALTADYPRFAGAAIVTAGAFRSTWMPAIGPDVAQLPATSQTLRGPVVAFAVSVPAATNVTSSNCASAADARPEPTSDAVHAIATFAPYHPASVRPTAA